MLTQHPVDRRSVSAPALSLMARWTRWRWADALQRIAPYAVTVAATIFFFRRTLFAGLLPGDVGDARWTIAVYEHWYEVWQGDESLRTIPFFFPTGQTLGMSDAYLVQGQLHALARAVGLDHVSAWVAATIGSYLVGALGVAFLSTLVLRLTVFRCAFVALACLSYPITIMIGHPQLAGFPALSWIFAGAVLLCRPQGGAAGVYLIIIGTPLLVLSSWYAALLGILTLLTATGFLALLTPVPLLKRLLVQAGSAIRASFSSWYGRLAWAGSCVLWALAVWIYLPARGISPAGRWEEVALYSPRLSDLVNASRGGGGVWSFVYDVAFDPATVTEERALGFTPLLFVAFVVAGAAGLRRLAVVSTQGSTVSSPLRPRTAALCAAGAFAVLSLAMIMVVDERGNSVFRLLWEFAPGFDTVRSPFRIQVVLHALAIFVVVAALEAWLPRWTPDQSGEGEPARPARGLVRGLVTVFVVLGILVEAQRDLPSHWNAAELAPPGLVAQIPTIQDSCAAFVLDDDLYPEAGSPRAAVDAVMLAMLSEVPTADGYSRAAPTGHPGFATSPATLVEWMRSRGYDGDVCVVSAEGVEIVEGRSG